MILLRVEMRYKSDLVVASLLDIVDCIVPVKESITEQPCVFFLKGKR